MRLEDQELGHVLVVATCHLPDYITEATVPILDE